MNRILSLDLQDDLFRADWQEKVARVAFALHECSEGLHKYYSSLTVKEKRTSWFPMPTLVPSDFSQPLSRPAFGPSPPFPGLKILARLSRDGKVMSEKENNSIKPEEMRHNLFVATLGADGTEPRMVTVKITRTYNRATHKLLAGASPSLAPTLHLCERVIGNLYVVVMDWIDGTTLNNSNLEEDSQHAVLNELKRALDCLRHAKRVHGDLRAPNIMVEKTGNTKIIDFDWSAEEDNGYYQVQSI